MRLSEAEFWLMTPKQFHLLWTRHREELMHREMIAAFTTSAIINFSIYRPAEAVQPKDFMPNYEPPKAEIVPKGKPIDDEVLSDFRSRRANIAALLEIYRSTGKVGPYLIEIGLVAANG